VSLSDSISTEFLCLIIRTDAHVVYDTEGFPRFIATMFRLLPSLATPAPPYSLHRPLQKARYYYLRFKVPPCISLAS
jgi:hypothetical protein